MKFGKVEDPSKVDFTLPADHGQTTQVLSDHKGTNTKFHVGCAKWNRQDLKGFYPRGTKDELTYYATQFNSIELNATFYRIFGEETVQKWYDKTPPDFKFFPKVPQIISQFKRLKNVDAELDSYFASIGTLKEKLGTIFLQMHPTFKPANFESLENFIQIWPEDVSLAIELRHPEWYEDATVNDEFCHLMAENNITHIITDTAGRRDLVHMRLTTAKTFIRYTGANHASDYSRLDDWLVRIKEWANSGTEEINFFVHQNLEKASPLLSAHLIKGLNKELGLHLAIPHLDKAPSLF